ncbi:lytic murein transglycosylase [Methylosinus sp. PW1]|uniref:lytic murein transglycosylase n=1 Tax=Methylosinus sp. PW1 TaxID=107636 RepID=UPI001FD9DC0C|nr:lytic murein transglycosylase [Methylosinus sp. PW1]
MRQAFGHARANRRDVFQTLPVIFLLFVLTAFFIPRALAQESAAGQDLDHFLQQLWPRARDAGVSREIFDSAVAGLTPEPGLLRRPQAQAEFTISIPSYVASAVSAARVARGRALASELSTPLATIEERSGVPSEIALAILGVESNFGSATGAADTLRVLATLAYAGHRGAIFADEFVAALVMLQRGDVTRARLRGSWAGAMGQPQFLPSAYLKYAASYAGGAAPDIWTNRLDSLASIANFLKFSGWDPRLPWAVEVVLPKNFDYADFDLDFAQWRALGVAAANGEALPASGAASLYLPAGATGPAFLITDNFEVIRKYNTSDAYALSIGLLADRIAGRRAPVVPWPKKTAALSTADCKELQRLLTARGFYRGAIDGKLGRTSRNAVHAFQLSEGVQPADGFATKEVLERLRR